MGKHRGKRQAELLFPPTWGGRRKGAGRKKKDPSAVTHVRRPWLNPRHPLHVTLKVTDRVWSLRSKRSFRVIEAAFRTGSDRLGMRLTHYSVQGNHLHLIVEADDRQSLSRGMQGLTIRLSKALNRLMGTRGKVFAHRFYSRALATPAEVRTVISYVLSNAFKHGLLPPGVTHDPFAGGRDLRGQLRPTVSGGLPPVAEPRTWLLRVGWDKAKPSEAT